MMKEFEKFWGAQFRKEPNKDFFEFEKSIAYDCKLAKYDVYHSLIHIEALYEEEILNKEEYEKLKKALEEILDDIQKGTFRIQKNCEDIHIDIQKKVEKKVGKIAQKLHTLRSRNDQIVFDEKFYCYENAESIANLLKKLLASLEFLRRKYKSVDFIAYTHLRRAQIIPFYDYIGAFKEMFLRDLKRITNFIQNLAIYIGSGAVAGSSLKEAYRKVLKKKNFKSFKKVKPYSNPLDNVSDRDFLIEFLSILSILQMHLSRICEDFILYSSKEFDFLILPEEFCTGSSLLPHKKNPDFLELVRGFSGPVFSALVSLLVTMKGLPLSYNRDVQINKLPLFSSTEVIRDEIKLMASFVKKIKLNKEKIEKEKKDNSLYAPEIVEYLVYQGVPFSSAYKSIAQLIKYCEENKIDLRKIPEKILRKFNKKLTQEVIKKLLPF